MKTNYLLTEQDISKRLDIDIREPIRLFDLQGLGIDQQAFIKELAPTFILLPWDMYDVKKAQVHFLEQRYPNSRVLLRERFLPRYYADEAKLGNIYDYLNRLTAADLAEFKRIRPWRKRSIFKFVLCRHTDNQWLVSSEPFNAFSQETEANDERLLERSFHGTSSRVINNWHLQKLILAIAEIVNEVRHGVQILELTMHQVSVLSDILLKGAGAPEGTHQDGADYIVSALVIQRVGVVGGESLVYGGDKQTEYLRTTLQVGQGIFHKDSDSNIWHDVTPLEYDKNTPELDGFRDILGFDINVVR